MDGVLPRVLGEEDVELIESLLEVFDRLDQFRQQMKPGLHFRLIVLFGEQKHPGLGYV